MENKIWKIANPIGEISNYDQFVNFPIYDFKYNGLNYEEIIFGTLHENQAAKLFYDSTKQNIIGAEQNINNFLISSSGTKVKINNVLYDVITNDKLPGYSGESPTFAVAKINNSYAYPMIREDFQIEWFVNYNSFNNLSDVATSKDLEIVGKNTILKNDEVFLDGWPAYKYRLVEKNTGNILHIIQKFKQTQIVSFGENNETQINIDFQNSQLNIGDLVTNKKITSKSYTLKLEILGCDKWEKKQIIYFLGKLTNYSQNFEDSTFLQVSNDLHNENLDENTFLNQQIIIKSFKESGSTFDGQNWTVEFEIFAPANIWFKGEKELLSNAFIKVPHVEESPLNLGRLIWKMNGKIIYSNRDFKKLRVYDAISGDLIKDYGDVFNIFLFTDRDSTDVLGSQQLSDGRQFSFIRSLKDGALKIYSLKFENDGVTPKVIFWDLSGNGINPQSNYSFTGVWHTTNIKWGNNNSILPTFMVTYEIGAVKYVQTILNPDNGQFTKREYNHNINSQFIALSFEPHVTTNDIFYIAMFMFDADYRRMEIWKGKIIGNNVFSFEWTKIIRRQYTTDVKAYIASKTGVQNPYFWNYALTLKGNYLFLTEPNYEKTGANANALLINKYNIANNANNANSNFTTLYQIPNIFDRMNENLINFSLQTNPATIRQSGDQYFNQQVYDNYFLIPSLNLSSGLRNYFRFDLNKVGPTLTIDYVGQQQNTISNEIAKSCYDFIIYSTPSQYSNTRLYETWTLNKKVFNYMASEYGHYNFVFCNEGDLQPDLEIRIEKAENGANIQINEDKINIYNCENVVVKINFNNIFESYYENLIDNVQHKILDASDLFYTDFPSTIKIKKGTNIIKVTNMTANILIREYLK